MTDQVPTSPPTSRERIAVRWWLAVLSVVLGVLVLVWAGLVAHDLTWLRGEGAAYWSGLAVNVGTSLLLAAVLIGLERAIVKKVREERQAAVTAAATQAAEIAAENAAQRTAEAIQPRLADLDRRIRDQSSSRIKNATDAAQRVADLGTYDSVHDALAEAAGIDAIAKARTGEDSWSTMAWEVIVPAGETIAAPRVRVTYQSGPTLTEGIMFSLFEHRETAVVWAPARAPEAVVDDLYEALVRAGLAPIARKMSAEALFQNLSVALRDALLRRRAASDEWDSTEPLIEMVSDGVLITDAGIEVRGHGLLVRRTAFGWYDPGDPEIGIYGQSIPDRPDVIDEATWSELVKRGSYHLPEPDGDRW